MTTHTRERIYAGLLGLGACILLYRTLAMFAGGAMSLLVAWVASLLVLEFITDAVTLAGSVRWFVTGDPSRATLVLRCGAAAALIHALRVLVFALGRFEPWLNFDVRPEFHHDHAERWTWGEVYFASTMSVLGVIGVLVIWRARRRAVSKRPAQ